MNQSCGAAPCLVSIPPSCILDLPQSPEEFKSPIVVEEMMIQKKVGMSLSEIKCFSNTVSKHWFTTYESYTERFLGEDLFATLLFFLKVFSLVKKQEMFPNMLCYVQRYIASVGRLSPVYIWSVFVTCSIVSLREAGTDDQYSNATLASLFSIKMEEMEAVEKNFLIAINNDLTLTTTDIAQILEFCKEEV